MLINNFSFNNYNDKSIKIKPIQKSNISSQEKQHCLAFTGGNSQKLAEFLYDIAQFVERKPREADKPLIINNLKNIINEKMNKISPGQPLIFAMPAFPFKSPSRDKTMSDSLDRAEEESIEFLKLLMGKAEQNYGEDLKLKIISDGIFFAPIKNVPFSSVIKYSDDLRKVIGNNDNIELISLDKIYPAAFSTKATEIIEKQGRPIEKIREEIKQGGFLNNSFNGIHRFYTEEGRGQNHSLSRAQSEKAGKQRAYRVIQAAEAVNNLIQNLEPEAIRLSVHPQLFISKKIGIPLTPSAQNITPWHSSAVEYTDKLGTTRIALIKAQEARVQGLEVVYREDGRLHYFKAPKGKIVEINPHYKCHQPPGLL